MIFIQVQIIIRVLFFVVAQYTVIQSSVLFISLMWLRQHSPSVFELFNVLSLAVSGVEEFSNYKPPHHLHKGAHRDACTSAFQTRANTTTRQLDSRDCDLNGKYEEVIAMSTMLEKPFGVCAL
jgi:hypothetical protein